MLDRHYNYCECKKIKIKHSKVCLSCYILHKKLNKKEKKKKDNPKDLCSCGNIKQKVSDECRQCYIAKKIFKFSKKIECIKCGNFKSYKSKNCQKCMKEKLNNEILNRTIEYYSVMNEGNANTYVHIRSKARNIMKNSKTVKECFNCKYNKHVEVCHKRSIKEYSKDIKISVVNSIDNLVYLCPNCHWEFDNGLINVT